MSDYDYHLPEALIAQTPLADRTASRLLHLPRVSGGPTHRQFADVVEILQAGDLLVLNNTRVSALRLVGTKLTGGQVEVLLLTELASPSSDRKFFRAMLKPAKRLPVGSTIHFLAGLVGTVESKSEDGLAIVSFVNDPDLDRKLEAVGKTPLPPYIHETLADAERYQTVYGQVPGSSAAPTAGLHFSAPLLDALRAKGVQVAWVTLHVGIDTFRPIAVEDLNFHQMHGEICTVPPETAQAIQDATRRIIAVGTTTVRTLETHATGHRRITSGSTVSKLFIRPGFVFKIIDGIFTNFHLPRTTMMAMISAFADRNRVLSAYDVAVSEGYRFLSFGDSMLIL